MQNSIEHYTEKFEEILEEKTDEVEKKIEETPPKTKVEEFNWGDITIPKKF